MLDLTRLISRTGRGLTGVDRVELAYLRYLSELDHPVFGLVRTALGYILLDRSGLRALLQRVDGDAPWGPIDRLSSLARGIGPGVRAAQSDMRRLAVARCRTGRLARMLKTHVPKGAAYLNVGHSNLTERTLWGVRHGLAGQIAVMVHDTIPLDFPQFQRPGSVDRYRALLRRVGAKADLVLYNSAHTQRRAEEFLADWGRVPASVVAHLGITLASERGDQLPAGLNLDRPYFVTVGTIEPRKNHALLLDLWDEMEAPPGLMICGARGWNNEAVFARLDRLPPGGPVVELNDLSDGALVTLVKGSCGVLLPSFAEGFGLPGAEAACLGLPVVSADLDSVREILGDIPVYASVSDRYLWKEIVHSLEKKHGMRQKAGTEHILDMLNWNNHFKAVLSLT